MVNRSFMKNVLLLILLTVLSSCFNPKEVAYQNGAYKGYVTGCLQFQPILSREMFYMTKERCQFKADMYLNNVKCAQAASECQIK